VGEQINRKEIITTLECKEDSRSANGNFMRKPEGKKNPLGRLDVHGEVIKMNDQEIGYEGMDC
jgi:hypothetical protein